LEIAAITSDDFAGQELARELRRTRAKVQHIWPSPERIPENFDIVYCDYASDLPKRLPWSPGAPPAALVLVLRPSQTIDTQNIENCAPHAILHLPLAPHAVVSSLTVALSVFRYERRLRQRIDKLDENLRNTRNVERAKTVLMRQKGLTEDAAYSYLRMQAMNRRVSIGTLAAAIVDSQELLL
jgi:AmiR/NasT family two-component response regulator